MIEGGVTKKKREEVFIVFIVELEVVGPPRHSVYSEKTRGPGGSPGGHPWE